MVEERKDETQAQEKDQVKATEGDQVLAKDLLKKPNERIRWEAMDEQILIRFDLI